MRFRFLQSAIDTIKRLPKPQTTIDTPHGEVHFSEIEIPKDQKLFDELREISEQELDSLRTDASKVPELVDSYVDANSQPTHPLNLLDFVFAEWLNCTAPAKESPEEVIRILGSAFGFFCIEHLGVRWVWCKDRYGEGISLYREKPQALANPFTSIQYRIEDHKTDFIYALFAALEYQIRSIDCPSDNG